MTVHVAPAEEVYHKPRFRLLADVELANLPPITWRIDQYVPQGGFAFLYGPSGSGKSFLTLSWAMAVATGTDWMGRKVAWGPVVYVAAEGGRGFAQRVQAYRDAHELVEPSAAYFVTEPVNLMDTDEVTDLLKGVHSRVPGQPGLFVFDTLARCMAGGDENKAQDIGIVVAALDRIRLETHADVLLTHHTGWLPERERGSSALRAAADAIFSLKNEAGARP